MVNDVGVKVPMQSEYWSKKLGEKAVFVSQPAKQPDRKGPSKSRNVNLAETMSVVKCPDAGKCFYTMDCCDESMSKN